MKPRLSRTVNRLIPKKTTIIERWVVDAVAVDNTTADIKRTPTSTAVKHGVKVLTHVPTLTAGDTVTVWWLNGHPMCVFGQFPS